MSLAEPFRLEGDHIACALPGGRVLFTTRRGGVSDGPYRSLNLGVLTGDDPARVRANRERLAEAVGIPRGHTAQGRQVHGPRVARVAAPPGPDAPPGEADGQATALTGVATAVLTADCLPVALVADGAVAMLHGGWRGLAGGIVAEGVAALRELGACGPIRAAIGPGAGRCCYEVGEEVHGRFAALGPDVREGRNLDMKLVASRRLEEAGVDEVHDTGLCTMCADPELFFSHRRDAVTGRQAGVAWRS